VLVVFISAEFGIAIV